MITMYYYEANETKKGIDICRLPEKVKNHDERGVIERIGSSDMLLIVAENEEDAKEIYRYYKNKNSYNSDSQFEDNFFEEREKLRAMWY